MEPHEKVIGFALCTSRCITRIISIFQSKNEKCVWRGGWERNFYFKSDDVISLLDALIGLLHQGCALKRKRRSQNGHLGEVMRVWAKGIAVGRKRRGDLWNWQDLVVSRCKDDGRTKDVDTLVGKKGRMLKQTMPSGLSYHLWRS